MKKKRKPAVVAKVHPMAALVKQVRSLVQSARQAVASAVNTLQVHTNYEIGRLIVEHEQQGAERAEYGKETVKVLAESLTREFGRGYSEDNLSRMRKFYLLWRDRISATVSRKLLSGQESQAASNPSGSISATPSRKSSLPPFEVSPPPISQKLSAKFTLSWSHYVILIGIDDPSERSFYEIESANSGWSFRQLKRQVASSLYERLALSRDKKRVRQLAEEGHTVSGPADLLKNPLVLEFLGLEERPVYSESDLETALIDRLQHFLLELGKGFLFEARQKRFSFDGDDYFVDLVFYNRLLRCYVLLDLKIGKLTHQDLGQMQMYVNHYDRHVKQPDEHPTVGFILCKRKSDALVQITLPKQANIFASEYRLYLPSKKELQHRLLEWAEESA